MNGETCRIRDLALVAVLQYRGILPLEMVREKENGQDYISFLFALNQESKQIMGDYRYSRITVDPKSFIVFYRSIKNQINKIKYGNASPTTMKEEKNGRGETRS